MEAGNTDASQTKFPRLQPKSSLDEELAMSKVHISKNWKLPPRLKPGRRPQTKSKNSDDDEPEDSEDEHKKKKQNRDAQRAYRERRTNRLQDLENTVHTLQNTVKSWKRKCKDFETELENVREDNSSLRSQLNEIKSKNCGACFKDPCVFPSESITLFQDPFLQNIVNNFKPMKAVNLKKRKLDSSKSSESPIPQQQIGSVTSSDGCGFCTDSTTCVCKDLEESQQELQHKHEMSLTATLGHCSSSKKGYCENCADINKSCLTVEPAPAPAEMSKTKSSHFNWEPGSCAHCQSDPESKAFCKSVCSSASIVAAAEANNKKTCSPSLGSKSGPCSQCQGDSQCKDPREAAFPNNKQQQSFNQGLNTDFLPAGSASQRPGNCEVTERSRSVYSNPLAPPMKQTASSIRIDGREGGSESINNAFRDMDKNTLS